MVKTPPLPEGAMGHTLPVQLSIGTHTADVGTITVEPGEPVGGQVAEFLRAVADVIDDDTDEDGED